jgi:hypothetical protein
MLPPPNLLRYVQYEYLQERECVEEKQHVATNYNQTLFITLTLITYLLRVPFQFT